jgi:plasmid replication initiation protein
VVCALTSKYAIALYEMVQLRANLDRCIETFPIARFRDLLGVPPKAYEQGTDFIKRVTNPAMLEVNGLSDVGVDLALVRRGRFAPIEAVTVTWWKKQGDEFRAAMRERSQSKVGRMARLKGTVEMAQPMDALA